MSNKNKFRNVRGKVAIITGAAHGLGKGIAETLAIEGVHVIIADLSKDVFDVFKDIKEKNRENKGFAVKVNVTKEPEVKKMVEGVVDKLGRIDIMVNNAGICIPEPEIVYSTEKLLDKIMAVNLKGVFFGSKYAAQQMKKQGGGTIVNMGSYCGKIAFPKLGFYSASKAAVHSFTQALALEIASYKITANCLCPGDAATNMHWTFVKKDAEERGISIEEMKKHELEKIPLGRYGYGKDYAGAIIWLASKAGSYVTGQAINIDGGKNYFC